MQNGTTQRRTLASNGGWSRPPLRVGVRADQLVREGYSYNMAMVQAWAEDKAKKAAKRSAK